MLDIHLVPVLKDNYVYILVDQATGDAAVLDPGEGTPVIEALEDRGIEPKYILNTHHHWDHTNGNPKLAKRYGAEIVAPKGENRIKGVTHEVWDGDTFTLGGSKAQIISTPGHTTHSICFYFAEDKALFCGDTLFSIGCGRLFEGTAEMMFDSFQKLKALLDEVKVYCGHEYTEANVKWAQNLLNDNEDLEKYAHEVSKQRSYGLPSIPSMMGVEKKANPFMLATSAKEFQKFRDHKDKF